MEKFTAVKICLLTAIVSGLCGAIVTRNYLVPFHKADLAKQDQACMRSVFRVTEIVKKHKRKVPKPVFVVEGSTK